MRALAGAHGYQPLPLDIGAEEDQGVFVKDFNYTDADVFFHRSQTRFDQSQAHASLRSEEVVML